MASGLYFLRRWNKNRLSSSGFAKSEPASEIATVDSFFSLASPVGVGGDGGDLAPARINLLSARDILTLSLNEVQGINAISLQQGMPDFATSTLSYTNSTITAKALSSISRNFAHIFTIMICD
jgi:hypothetical protein